MNKILLTSAAFLTTVLTGCTNRLTDFTIISTKNVEIGALARAKRGDKRVNGEDVAHIIIFIPTGISNLKEAIDRAIESVPGAVALVDGVVYQRAFYIPYIYGQTAFIVEGTPLIMGGSTADTNVKKGRYVVSRYDRATKAFVAQSVSKEKFETLAKTVRNGKASVAGTTR